MIGDVEVAIVDPHRPGQAHRDLPHLLPVARNLRQPLFDGGQQRLIAQPVARLAQDRQRTDVHRRRGVLQLIERGVRRRQPGHIAAPPYVPYELVHSTICRHANRPSRLRTARVRRRGRCAMIIRFVCHSPAGRSMAPHVSRESSVSTVSHPSYTARRPANRRGHPRRRLRAAARDVRHVPAPVTDHAAAAQYPAPPRHPLEPACRCRCAQAASSPTPRCAGCSKSSTAAGRSPTAAVLAAGLVDSVLSAICADAPGRRGGAAPGAAAAGEVSTAAEVFGTYSRGQRVHAIACRIEQFAGRWQVVALHIG